MNITIYKRLFEVRFLHEFYLSDRMQGGALFFSKTPAQRQSYLEEETKNRRYNILRDLQFEPTPDTARLLAGRRMKFKETITGFIVGAEVKPETVNGIVRYKPATSMEKGLRMTFYVLMKNPQFLSFTALRLRQSNLSAYYLFTNSGKPPAGTPFISLSENAPGFTTGHTYEPGELARFNANLNEAVARTNNTTPANWSPVNGDGYANENDRSALGKQFQWQWTMTPQNVRFVLKNEALEEVKVINTTFTQDSRIIYLDFSRKYPRPDQRNGDPIPDGFYTLEAQGTQDTFSKKVYLHDELNKDYRFSSVRAAATPALLGIVQIEATESQDGVPFIDNNGYIRREALPGGGFTHIIYEVRWLNRSAWWRYRSGQDKMLKAVGAAQAHLTQSGKDLVSNTPLRFSSYQKALATDVNLPNATPDQFKPDPAGRYFADILVSKVPNLIEAI